jgi:hypothetical protein
MDKNFKAVNEPIIDFEPGSKHRELLIQVDKKIFQLLFTEKRLELAILNYVQNLMTMVMY